MVPVLDNAVMSVPGIHLSFSDWMSNVSGTRFPLAVPLLCCAWSPATDELKCYLFQLPRRHVYGAAGMDGRPAGLWAGRLRGLQLAGLAPPRHARHAGPLLRGARDAAAPPKDPA